MTYRKTLSNVVDVSRAKIWLARLSALVILAAFQPAVFASSWKDELKAEEAKNNTRIDAIEVEGKPIAAELRQVTQAISAHNAQHPDGVCTYPAGHPEVCTPWIREATTLNTKRDSLRSRLQPLVDESDRLIARNKKIDQLLKCVPLPNACKSDSDCNACSSCSTFDGRGNSGQCQPRP